MESTNAVGDKRVRAESTEGETALDQPTTKRQAPISWETSLLTALLSPLLDGEIREDIWYIVGPRIRRFASLFDNHGGWIDLNQPIRGRTSRRTLLCAALGFISSLQARMEGLSRWVPVAGEKLADFRGTSDPHAIFVKVVIRHLEGHHVFTPDESTDPTVWGVLESMFMCENAELAFRFLYILLRLFKNSNTHCSPKDMKSLQLILLHVAFIDKDLGSMAEFDSSRVMEVAQRMHDAGIDLSRMTFLHDLARGPSVLHDTSLLMLTLMLRDFRLFDVTKVDDSGRFFYQLYREDAVERTHWILRWNQKHVPAIKLALDQAGLDVTDVASIVVEYLDGSGRPFEWPTEEEVNAELDEIMQGPSKPEETPSVDAAAQSDASNDTGAQSNASSRPPSPVDVDPALVFVPPI
jgi:hypothetical protein